MFWFWKKEKTTLEIEGKQVCVCLCAGEGGGGLGGREEWKVLFWNFQIKREETTLDNRYQHIFQSYKESEKSNWLSKAELQLTFLQRVTKKSKLICSHTSQKDDGTRVFLKSDWNSQI